MLAKTFSWSWNCLHWGRSNLVDPAEWPKIGSLNQVLDLLADFCQFFSRKNSKTQSSLNFLQSGRRNFTNSKFSGSAPVRRVLMVCHFLGQELGQCLTTVRPEFETQFPVLVFQQRHAQNHSEHYSERKTQVCHWLPRPVGCRKSVLSALLGGNFGPEEKYLAPPPPKNSPQTPPGPQHPPSPLPEKEGPPPSWDFQWTPPPFFPEQKTEKISETSRKACLR